ETFHEAVRRALKQRASRARAITRQKPKERRRQLGRSRITMRALSSIDRTELTRFAGRLLTLARTEIALLTALFVGAVGVLTFIEVADDMTEADGRAFDAAILDVLRPHADPAHAWGPWWLEEAMADVTSLGGISVLGLFAVAVVGF